MINFKIRIVYYECYSWMISGHFLTIADVRKKKRRNQHQRMSQLQFLNFQEWRTDDLTNSFLILYTFFHEGVSYSVRDLKPCLLKCEHLVLVTRILYVFLFETFPLPSKPFYPCLAYCMAVVAQSWTYINISLLLFETKLMWDLCAVNISCSSEKTQIDLIFYY